MMNPHSKGAGLFVQGAHQRAWSSCGFDCVVFRSCSNVDLTFIQSPAKFLSTAPLTHLAGWGEQGVSEYEVDTKRSAHYAFACWKVLHHSWWSFQAIVSISCETKCLLVIAYNQAMKQTQEPHNGVQTYHMLSCPGSSTSTSIRPIISMQPRAMPTIATHLFPVWRTLSIPARAA